MLLKTVITLVVATLVFTGCKDSGKNSTEGNNKANNEKPIRRDLSIDKNNSFNDIFLDSGSVEQFIITEKLNDTMSTAIRGFYNARNFEFAWFSSYGLIEQSFSFRSLYTSDNSTDVLNKSLENRLDRMRVEKDQTVDAKDTSTIKTELQITERFIQYAVENYAKLGISPAALGTYIPAKKTKILALADALLANNKVNNTYAALNESYRLLKTPLQKYSTIEKKGGWKAIPLTLNKYNIGTSDPTITGIKKRLQITGELTGNDTSQLSNAELALAIKAYQSTHGFKATGEITQDLVKDLNISALARLQQLLINMQRMRWMPTHPDGIIIIVNIPAFEVYVDSGKNTLFEMGVVVGKEGYNTTMFSGSLNQIVFSPYWNIPPSIVREEIMPRLRRDKNYLNKRDMEITGRDGDLPVIRQRPGEKNALGKVKFLFPNSFNIYMHDTHEKGFFNRSERGLSHGCVRLSDATKMANFLLRNSNEWTPEKIKTAMNSGKEQYVKLKEPLPVIITYYTAWVGTNGELHFVNDIYEHDKHMAQKMFVDTL